MFFNSRLEEKYQALTWQKITVFLTFLSLYIMSLPAYSLELGLSGHQGEEYETQGYSIFIADNFTRRSPFYWSVGFNRYDELYVKWNKRTLKFPLNSVEASLSYRQKFRSRSLLMRRVSLEYQVGVAASLTDNKFTWAELGEEKYFSETGDVNGFLAFSAHYQINQNLSAFGGIRHFPALSEFGSISSAFLGIKYNFSFGPTYYGN